MNICIYIRVYEYAQQCTMHIDIYKYIQTQTCIYRYIYIFKIHAYKNTYSVFLFEHSHG